ncbi:hypothetical protein LXL04_025466 [Taraxacum kok-saghyz]
MTDVMDLGNRSGLKCPNRHLVQNDVKFRSEASLNYVYCSKGLLNCMCNILIPECKKGNGLFFALFKVTLPSIVENNLRDQLCKKTTTPTLPEKRHSSATDSFSGKTTFVGDQLCKKTTTPNHMLRSSKSSMIDPIQVFSDGLWCVAIQLEKISVTTFGAICTTHSKQAMETPMIALGKRNLIQSMPTFEAGSVQLPTNSNVTPNKKERDEVQRHTTDTKSIKESYKEDISEDKVNARKEVRSYSKRLLKKKEEESPYTPKVSKKKEKKKTIQIPLSKPFSLDSTPFTLNP